MSILTVKRNTLIYYLTHYDFVQYTTVYEYFKLSGVGNSTFAIHFSVHFTMTFSKGYFIRRSLQQVHSYEKNFGAC